MGKVTIQPPSEAQTKLPVPWLQRSTVPPTISSGGSQDQGCQALPRCLTGTKAVFSLRVSAFANLECAA